MRLEGLLTASIDKRGIGLEIGPTSDPGALRRADAMRSRTAPHVQVETLSGPTELACSYCLTVVKVQGPPHATSRYHLLLLSTSMDRHEGFRAPCRWPAFATSTFPETRTPMNLKYLSIALSIGACLGLAACSDKTPEADAPVPGATAPASTVDDAVAAAPAATTVAPWTGDLAAATAETHCALDLLNGSTATDGRLTLPTGDPALFEGWVGSSDMRSAPTFSLVLDGATDYQLSGSTGVPRDDVAKALSSDQLANAGFQLNVPSLVVPVGDYKLVLVHQENGALMSCETSLVLAVN